MLCQGNDSTWVLPGAPFRLGALCRWGCTEPGVSPARVLQLEKGKQKARECLAQGHNFTDRPEKLWLQPQQHTQIHQTLP